MNIDKDIRTGFSNEFQNLRHFLNVFSGAEWRRDRTSGPV
ncbi:hypothetical protein LEP1GSC163_1003 [Leptospira santarosai str. CBC379]|uniref:Uncharacterized protein n=1 Tax=Leptospira santarosai str. ZUN179 TaxID=1049985 RepID=M6UJ97_9LEPT|nr:hypothetical protein LEP1GSC163_1003 [Leptospira santarosai str. CBC379]EMM84892.1 hypothetical protein LEP1GSC039_0222 [Leptospira santarosai str. 2000027870]EMO45207.1 hypothetical protein LEP1GSC187_1719 [Leptospira santarosai str. ZUN179]EMO70131.1 hypothetical protein LEP1GSC130_3182 [Leptospira santarosai str. 200403458]